MLGVPNLPDERVPVGPDAESNTIYREGGELLELDFRPRNRIGKSPSDSASSTSSAASRSPGTRGYFMRDDGARLQRALVTWMLDVHTNRHGYTELVVPHLVTASRWSARGTCPKFARRRCSRTKRKTSG